MNRIGYYVFRWYAVAIKLISQKGYDKWIVRAHKKAGVIFIGSPEYIDSHSHLDPSGGLTIMWGAVISTNVIILTHDWSFLKGLILSIRLMNVFLHFMLLLIMASALEKIVSSVLEP